LEQDISIAAKCAGGERIPAVVAKTEEEERMKMATSRVDKGERAASGRPAAACDATR
jgi:hypothetical protein